MSNNYIPTTWIGSKTIGTADVMNNIEKGIGSAHDRLDDFLTNPGNVIKSATITSTTETNGNISLSANYSNNIVLSVESLNYIVLLRKISDRYTLYVYNPTSTGLEPVKSTEITYIIYYV